MKKISMLLLAVLLLAACDPNGAQKMLISPQTITAPNEGGEFDLSIIVSEDWTATVSDSWIEVTPSSGKSAITKLKVYVAPAENNSESTGKVTFTCGDETATLTVIRSSKTDDSNVGKNTIKVTPTQINATAQGGYYSVNIVTEVKWNVVCDVDWVKLNKTEGNGNDSIYVAISPNNVSNEMQSGTITISEADSADNKVEIAVTREGMVVEPSFNYAYFSVDSNKKVQFSSGNLQYQASTGKWRFAKFQYDIIGEDNANISDTYNGWIDLFGWGTGSNPTLHSTNAADYSSYSEWGNHTVSNDDYDKPYYGQWVTLRHYEWKYLLFKRRNAASLFALGKVNGVNGVIILPDDWQLPAGMTFKTSVEQGLAESTSNNGNATDPCYVWSGANPGQNFAENTYTAAQWAIMEKSGAVFLPAAGYRVGNQVTLIRDIYSGGTTVPQELNSYWSSSVGSDNLYAYYFSFGYGLNNQGDVGVYSWGGKNYGYAVRLVYEEIVIN